MSSERKRYTSLTLNQKTEIIKLSKKCMLKDKIRQKLSLLHETGIQVENAKEKSLKKIKGDAPVITWMIVTWNSIIADVQKVLVVWVED